MFGNKYGRRSEEKIYSQIAKELEDGLISKGLWLKAETQANGDESKIRPLYVKFRFQSIVDEIDIKNDFAKIGNKPIDTKARKEEVFKFLEENGYFVKSSLTKFIVSRYSKPPPGAIIKKVYETSDISELEAWARDACKNK